MKLAVHHAFREDLDGIGQSSPKDKQIITSKLAALKGLLADLRHPALLPAKMWDCKQPQGLKGKDAKLPLWQFEMGNHRGYLLVAKDTAVVFGVHRRYDNRTVKRILAEMCARAHRLDERNREGD